MAGLFYFPCLNCVPNGGRYAHTDCKNDDRLKVTESQASRNSTAAKYRFFFGRLIYRRRGYLRVPIFGNLLFGSVESAILFANGQFEELGIPQPRLIEGVGGGY